MLRGADLEESEWLRQSVDPRDSLGPGLMVLAFLGSREAMGSLEDRHPALYARALSIYSPTPPPWKNLSNGILNTGSFCPATFLSEVGTHKPKFSSFPAPGAGEGSGTRQSRGAETTGTWQFSFVFAYAAVCLLSRSASCERCKSAGFLFRFVF